MGRWRATDAAMVCAGVYTFSGASRPPSSHSARMSNQEPHGLLMWASGHGPWLRVIASLAHQLAGLPRKPNGAFMLVADTVSAPPTQPARSDRSLPAGRRTTEESAGRPWEAFGIQGDSGGALPIPLCRFGDAAGPADASAEPTDAQGSGTDQLGPLSSRNRHPDSPRGSFQVPAQRATIKWEPSVVVSGVRLPT